MNFEPYPTFYQAPLWSGLWNGALAVALAALSALTTDWNYWISTSELGVFGWNHIWFFGCLTQAWIFSTSMLRKVCRLSIHQSQHSVYTVSFTAGAAVRQHVDTECRNWDPVRCDGRGEQPTRVDNSSESNGGWRIFFCLEELVVRRSSGEKILVVRSDVTVMVLRNAAITTLFGMYEKPCWKNWKLGINYQRSTG